MKIIETMEAVRSALIDAGLSPRELLLHAAHRHIYDNPHDTAYLDLRFTWSIAGRPAEWTVSISDELARDSAIAPDVLFADRVKKMADRFAEKVAAE